MPVIASHELVLAVAVDAGERDDLTGAHGQRGAADRLEITVVEHVQILDGEDRALRVGGLLVDAEDHVAPDHHARQRLLGRAGARDGAHRLAAAQNGDAVGDLKHLAELVGDEDDRGAVLPSGGAGPPSARVISWAVSTAVGSSSTRIRALR